MSITYQELFDQLQSEIAAAEKNNQPLTVCEKIIELSEAYIELAFGCMESINFSEAYTYFNLANEQSISFEEYHLQAGLDKSKGSLFDQNKQNLFLSSSFANFALGQYHVSNRNPGVAVDFFENARINFEELFQVSEAKAWSIFSKYCQAFKTYAEGLEDFLRASFGNSKVKLQRAMIGLGNLIEKEIPDIKEELEKEGRYETYLNRFKSDYQVIRSYYFLSDAKQQFNNRNFKAAAKQFGAVAKELNFSIVNYVDAASESIKNLSLGEYHNYLGWQILSEAELNREIEDWDKALSNYEQVRVEWEQAANYYLQSNLPSGVVLQETILNTSLTIDVYQSVCEKEKILKERINELEKQIEELNDTLINAMKPMGVVVNNTQEAVTTVEQNVQFIQNIENNAREGIKELLQALKDTNLEEALKKNIEQKGSEILNSKEKGHSFLDKVKNFTKDIAEIVKNVGDIAKPLIPGYKLLSMLI